MTDISLVESFPKNWIDAAQTGQLVRIHLLAGISQKPVGDINKFATTLVGHVNTSGINCSFVGAVRPQSAFPQLGFAVSTPQEARELASYLKGYIKGNCPDQGYSLEIN